MRFSYNKLWKLLIDKNLSKKELAEKSGISVTSVSKLSKGANVNTDILLKICIALECDITDIVEIIKQ